MYSYTYSKRHSFNDDIGLQNTMTLRHQRSQISRYEVINQNVSLFGNVKHNGFNAIQHESIRAPEQHSIKTERHQSIKAEILH